MNNWRDIKKIPPPCGVVNLRVKYVYRSYVGTTVSQTPYGAMTIPKIVSNEAYVGVDIIHVDPMNIYDPLSGGFRFSDLKGDFQNITHWMYTFDPYDESEEDLGVRKNKEQDTEEEINMIDREEIITTKTINMIDVSKFHVGCAYFIQSDMHGGSYITGILYAASEDGLIFTTNNGDYTINISDIMNPDKNFRFTLLLPEKYSHTFPDMYFNQK